MPTSTVAEMPDRQSWENKAVLTGYLGRQLRLGRLALIVGAGTSSGLGLPDWNSLIDRLFITANVPRPPTGKPEQAAARFKTVVCMDDNELYKSRVKDALYQGLNVDLRLFRLLRSSALLGSIGALVMSSRRGSAEVVTLNFDDFIERYLRYHGFDARPVAEPDEWSSNADVSIYHPHGFLPSDPRCDVSRKILFSDTEFLGAIGKPTWPWRARFESLLRSHTCLFLGVSGDDVNLRSLMEDVKPINSGTRRGEKYWGVSFRDPRPADVELDYQWENQGIYRQEMADYDELPDWLFEICQRANEA